MPRLRPHVAFTVIATVALFAAAATLGHAPAPVALAARWMVIAALVAFAASRRTLTLWILVAMVAGVEIGHDLPHSAVKLQVLGLIFLRLIRTIIAPLLFATLVSGIASHADLRRVGRMAWKAIL